MFEKFRVGVDIGGTNVQIALVNKDGEISLPKPCLHVRKWVMNIQSEISHSVLKIC